jgi:chaperonin GroEL (HSP60 family)
VIAALFVKPRCSYICVEQSFICLKNKNTCTSTPFSPTLHLHVLRYAGFEQQQKVFHNPKIAILNVELELKAEKSNAEVRISPEEYQAIIDAEWKLIYDKLDKIVNSGAKIVLSRLPVGDLATQYFADRGMFCAGRVPHEDLERVASATGGKTQTSLNDLNEGVLGSCELFEEKQVGGDRFNFFLGTPFQNACTIILRGGAEQFIAEAERSLHDSIMIVKRALQHHSVVAGGGAIEMELSKHLREYSKTIGSKIQMIISAYAKSLEFIPRQLSENAGFNATDIVNSLRASHAKGNSNMGVNIEKEGIINTFDSFVWEPALVKLNALSAATEAACMILSVDETIKNPKANNPVEDNRPVQVKPLCLRATCADIPCCFLRVFVVVNMCCILLAQGSAVYMVSHSFFVIFPGNAAPPLSPSTAPLATAKTSERDFAVTQPPLLIATYAV